MDYLAFEQPIADLEAEIKKLEQEEPLSAATAERIRQLRQELNQTVRQIFENLTPWQIVQVSRHKDRPHTVDYLSLVFDEFVELHGDRKFGDDREAILFGHPHLAHCLAISFRMSAAEVILRTLLEIATLLVANHH